MGVWKAKDCSRIWAGTFQSKSRDWENEIEYSLVLKKDHLFSSGNIKTQLSSEKSIGAWRKTLKRWCSSKVTKANWIRKQTGYHEPRNREAQREPQKQGKLM